MTKSEQFNAGLLDANRWAKQNQALCDEAAFLIGNAVQNREAFGSEPTEEENDRLAEILQYVGSNDNLDSDYLDGLRRGIMDFANKHKLPKEGHN